MSVVEKIINRFPSSSEAILTILSLDPELVSEINNDKSVTIILPTNQGLEKSLSYCSKECLERENFTNLKRIFRYHVIPGIVRLRGGYRSLEGDVVLFNPSGFINDRFPIKNIIDFEGKRLVFIDFAIWPKSVRFCCRDERQYLYQSEARLERGYGGLVYL